MHFKLLVIFVLRQSQNIFAFNAVSLGASSDDFLNVWQVKILHPEPEPVTKNTVILYPCRYNHMYFIEKTFEFDKWLKNLKDVKAKARILFRIQKIENDDHFGDCKSIGGGIRELRIDFAKGYRVYFGEKDGKIIILLVGGDKSSQRKDIQKAKEIWNNLKK